MIKLYTDLHIHGRFSRATSKDLTIKNLEKYARIKGITLLGTGDFTHPEWIQELKKELKDDGSGVLRTRTGFPFVLQTELSFIYSQNKKGRRIHNVVLAPNFEVVDQITESMLKIGRVDYDGRPIFGISCPEFMERMMSISRDIEVIPAHIWTPHFGLLGSISGFDSVRECFKEHEKNIHALETGLSSDPSMNWRLSALDKYTLVSNSDAHSFWPWRIGRECNVLQVKDAKDLSYKNILESIRTKKGFLETIEVDPNYGKYHLDGHRTCEVCLTPEESLKNKNKCPKCGKDLTLGVLYRVEQLADRELGFKPKSAIPFRKLIPLHEVISAVIGLGVSSQKVWIEYNKLIKEFGNELEILLNAEENKLRAVCSENIVEAIMKNRDGKLEIIPGYDGVYGYPVIGNKKGVKEPESLGSKPSKVKESKEKLKDNNLKAEINKKNKLKETQKGLGEF